jgi:hypothetical protein
MSIRSGVLSLVCLVGCLHPAGSATPRKPSPKSFVLQGPSPIAERVDGILSGKREAPSVASNGKESLVVWSDQRRWVGEKLGPNELFSVRLDAEGKLIPQSQKTLALENGAGGSLQSQVLSCGGQWVALFADPQYGEQISLVRLRADGSLVDSSPFRVGGFVGGSGFSAACHKDELLLAWTASKAKGESNKVVWGSWISLQGAPQEERFQISPKGDGSSYTTSYAPTVVFDGKGYWIAWSTNASGGSYPNQIVASFVQKGSSVGAPSLLGEGALVSAASVGGGRAIFVWPTLVANRGYQRVAVRVKDGAKQDASPVAVEPTVSYDNTEIQVTAHQEQYVISWISPPHRIRGVIIRSSGAAGAVQEMVARGQSLPYQTLRLQDATLTSVGSSLLWVWKEMYSPVPAYPEEPKMVSALVSPSQFTTEQEKKDTPSEVLSVGVNAQQDVSIASRGSEHLVVWIDTRGGFRRLYGAWLSETGEKIGNDFMISPDLPGVCQTPRVVAGRSGYLVLWEGPIKTEAGLVAVWLGPLATESKEPHFLARGLGGSERFDALFDGEQFQLAYLSYGDLIVSSWSESDGVGERVYVELSGKDVAYRTSPALLCAKTCSLAISAVSGGESWIEYTGHVGAERLKALPQRPTNHFIKRVSWLRSSGLLVWLETDGADGGGLVNLAEVGRKFEIKSSQKILRSWTSAIQTIRSAEREMLFWVESAWNGAPQARLSLYDGALRGDIWAEVMQASIAENPKGGFVVAWIAYDPETQSNRLYARLTSDSLEPPTLP